MNITEKTSKKLTVLLKQKLRIRVLFTFIGLLIPFAFVLNYMQVFDFPQLFLFDSYISASLLSFIIIIVCPLLLSYVYSFVAVSYFDQIAIDSLDGNEVDK